jgi:hypothetical protein
MSLRCSLDPPRWAPVLDPVFFFEAIQTHHPKQTRQFLHAKGPNGLTLPPLKIVPFLCICSTEISANNQTSNIGVKVILV